MNNIPHFEPVRTGPTWARSSVRAPSTTAARLSAEAGGFLDAPSGEGCATVSAEPNCVGTDARRCEGTASSGTGLLYRERGSSDGYARQLTPGVGALPESEHSLLGAGASEGTEGKVFVSSAPEVGSPRELGDHRVGDALKRPQPRSSGRADRLGVDEERNEAALLQRGPCWAFSQGLRRLRLHARACCQFWCTKELASCPFR